MSNAGWCTRSFALVVATSVVGCAGLAEEELASDEAELAASCATVTITTSTATVSPGGAVGVFGRVANCGTRGARFKVVASQTDPSGTPFPIGDYPELSSRIALGAGEAIGLSFGDPIPLGSPLGTYEVCFDVLGSKSVIASACATFVVQ